MDKRVSSKKSDLASKAVVHSCSQDFYTEFSYIAIRILGTGMTGDVMLAQARDGINQMVAVKRFSKKTPDTGKNNRKLFAREVSILQSLKHKYILGRTSAYDCPDDYVLTMPYYPLGTLREHLPDLTTDLTDKYLIQMSSALHYLHFGRKVTHRDVKPDNVLISEHGSVILSDFGLACKVSSTGISKNPQTQSGTPGYMAPELMDATRHATSLNLYKCDTYSLGVLLWQMVMRTEHRPDGDLLAFLPTSRFHHPEHQRHVLHQLLQPEPQTRWDLRQLVNYLFSVPRMPGVMSKHY